MGRKTRKMSKKEAVELMKSFHILLECAGYLLYADTKEKCAVLKDKENNEEFYFSVGGRLLHE